MDDELSPLVQSARNQLFDIAARKVAEGVTSGLVRVYKTQASGWGVIKVVGPARSVAFLADEGFDLLSIRPPSSLLGRIAARLDPGRKIWTMAGRVRLGGSLADEAFTAGESVALGRGVSMRLVSQEFANVLDEAASKAAAKQLSDVLGTGLSGVLSFGVQYASDYNNPYLTGKQKLRRAGVSGGFGVLAAYVGAVVNPAVGIVIAIILDVGVAPQFFEFIGAVPERRLAPLTP